MPTGRARRGRAPHSEPAHRLAYRSADYALGLVLRHSKKAPSNGSENAPMREIARRLYRAVRPGGKLSDFRHPCDVVLKAAKNAR